MTVLARFQPHSKILRPTRVFNRPSLPFNPGFRHWSSDGGNNSFTANNSSNMDLQAYVERLRSGAPPKFPTDANSLQFAQTLDSQDSLRHLRDEFILPTKASLKKRELDGTIPGKSKTARGNISTNTDVM